jgi:hypothetical protein
VRSFSVPRLFFQARSFTVRDVKVVAGYALDQRAGSLSGRVATVGFLCVHHHVHEPRPNAYQYDYSDSGEKVLAHTMTVIIITFASCFCIGAVPDGARAAP